MLCAHTVTQQWTWTIIIMHHRGYRPSPLQSCCPLLCSSAAAPYRVSPIANSRHVRVRVRGGSNWKINTNPHTNPPSCTYWCWCAYVHHHHATWYILHTTYYMRSRHAQVHIAQKELPSVSSLFIHSYFVSEELCTRSSVSTNSQCGSQQRRIL